MPHVRFPGARCCGNCRFAAPHAEGDLECHRNPPLVVHLGRPGAETVFPRVGRSTWCAQHAFAHSGPPMDRKAHAVLEWMQREAPEAPVPFTTLVMTFVDGRTVTAERLLRILRQLEEQGKITGVKPQGAEACYHVAKNSAAAPQEGGAR